MFFKIGIASLLALDTVQHNKTATQNHKLLFNAKA